MKKVIGMLICMAICQCFLPAAAQDSGDNLRQQAQECLNKKDYTKARYLFLQAYYAYAQGTQYDKAVACGVQASALYHRENYNQEAFELLASVEQTVANGEQKSGKAMPALRYPITRERLLIYTKQRTPTRAKAQLAQLEGWAEAAQNDSLDADLLRTKTRYYYAFGLDAQGDAAVRAFISRHDSIQQLAAQQKYDELNTQYQASLQTIKEKDGSLATRQYIIAGLGILATVLAAALVLSAIALLRLLAKNRKQQKAIRTANEHNALKTKFIQNISAQMTPTLNTLDATLPAVQALKTFAAHIEEMSALENSLDEPYALEEANALTFCEDIADKVKGETKENVAILVNAPKLSVKINREHVGKILTHLLQNAALHTPADGKIWLDFKKRGAHTQQFIVTDTGCGISEEQQADLFKPFAQVRNLAEGDGLGLPICSLEATKMNGTLTLDATYRKGARFVLELHA